MVFPKLTTRSLAIHRFLAQIFIAVGFLILVLAFLPQLFHVKLIPIDDLVGIALFMAILIYGVAMYITSTIYECYLDLKELLERR